MTQASNLGKGGSNFNSTGQLSLTTGVTGILPVANGGTGTTSTTFVNLTTNVTGTLPVANGGTGSTTLTANNVLLGNGTSALQVVAPGTAGNVLTSNGTTWSSTTPASGGFSGATVNAVGSSAITLTSSSTQYQVAQINSVANSTVNLPNATTLSTKGFAPYVIENRSIVGANLSIKDNAGTVVGYIPVGYVGLVALKDNSTSAGSWTVEQIQLQTFFNYDTASLTTTGASVTSYGDYDIVGLTSTTFVRCWAVDVAQTGSLKTQVGTISGSTITLGSVQTQTVNTAGGTSGGAGTGITVVRLSNTAFVVQVRYYNSIDVGCGGFDYSAGTNFRVCTVSGTTVTFGSSNACNTPSYSSSVQNNILRNSYYYNAMPTRLSDTSYAVIYNTGASTTVAVPLGYTGSLACTVVTVSGTTQTVGTAVSLGTSTNTASQSAVALSSTSLFVCYGQQTTTGGSVGRTKLNVISISGTVPTWGTSVTVESSDTSGIMNSYFAALSAVAPSSTQVLFIGGYFVGEGTVSGTTPTFDTYVANQVCSPIFLVSSTKAFSPTLNSYFNITTGGAFWTKNGIPLYQANSLIQSATPYSPLGAQPTTSFVGAANTDQLILGNSL